MGCGAGIGGRLGWCGYLGSVGWLTGLQRSRRSGRGRPTAFFDNLCGQGALAPPFGMTGVC